MSAAEREALEAVARPIVGKYVERALQTEDTRRSAQSMLQLVQEVLQRGCMVQFSTTDSLRLSPTQQWMVGVEWVLQQLDAQLGPATRYVLVFRLSRTPKKEESSFGRIAHDIEAAFKRNGRSSGWVSMEESEGLYRAALPMFVRMLNKRGIGRDVVNDSAVATYQPWHDPQSQRHLIAIGQRLRAFAVRKCHRRRNVPLAKDGTPLHDVSHGAHV